MTQPNYEGFKVLEQKDSRGNAIVELPSSYRVSVETDNNEVALQKAFDYNEKVKANRELDGKDPLYKDFLADDERFVQIVRNYYKDKDASSVNETWYQNDFSLIDNYINDMRWRDNNSVSMLKSLSYTSGGLSDEQKRRAVYMYQVWESMPAFHETGGAGFSGLMSNVGKAVFDPVNIFGLGLTKGVTKVFGKELLKSQQKRLVASIGTTAGADGLIGAGFAYSDQADRVNVGMQTKINMDVVVQAGAINLLAGTGFGASSEIIANRVSKSTVGKKASEKIKSTLRGTSIFANRYFTTHAGLGYKALETAQRFSGELNAIKMEVREKGADLELAIEKMAGSNYDDYIQDPQNLANIKDLIDYALDETAPDFMRSTKSVTGIPEGDLPNNINPLLKASVERSAKLKKSGQPVTEEIIIEGERKYVVSKIDPSIAEQQLNANPELKKSLYSFAESHSKLRTEMFEKGIIDDTVTDLFSKNTNKHLTKIYQAFLQPDQNLQRLYDPKNKTQLDSAHTYIAKQLNKSSSIAGTGFNKEDVNVRNIVRLMAQGKLNQARQVARDLSNNNDKVGIDLLKILEEDPNAPATDLINLLSDANDKGIIRSGDQFTAPTLTARTKLSKDMQNVLGVIDDPIERLIQTNINLNTLYKYSEFSNDITFELIRTGQINKGLVGGGSDLLNKKLKDFGIIRDETGKPIELGVDARTGEPRIKPDVDTEKTLQQAIQDGDITNAESMSFILRENDLIREEAFRSVTKKIDDGQVYNPLGAIQLTKEFQIELDQLLYGARFHMDGNQRIGLEVINKMNIIPQAMKTVYSPVTTARNFIGGGMQFLAVGGGVPLSPNQLSYLKNVYYPVWMEITKGMSKKQPLTEVTKRMRRKGFSDSDINSVMGDVRDLYSANILDTDLISDSSRMFAEQLKTPLYDSKFGGFSIRGFDTHMRRFYATGDELFKALYFNKRKTYYMNLGFSREEAVSRAAEQVRRHLPNYSIAPKGLKFARLGGIGTFTSFTTEILRNTKNIMVDIHKDFFEARKFIKEGRATGDAKKISIGNSMQIDTGKRLASITALLTASAGGVSWATQNIPSSIAEVADVNQEDSSVVKSRRHFLSSWSQTDQFVVLDKDKKGNIRFHNSSWVNPFAPIGKMFSGTIIRANQYMGQGRTVADAYTKAFAEAGYDSFSPYLNPGLGSGPVITSIMAALSEDERQLKKGLDTLVDNFTPGVAQEISEFFDTATGETLRQFERGPNLGKSQKYWDKVFNLGGAAIGYWNLEDGVNRKYKSLSFEYGASQGRAKSLLSKSGFGKKSKEVLFDMEDLKALTNINSNPGDVRKRDTLTKFVQSYVEENDKRFIAERNIYSAMLHHSVLLRDIGKNDNEVFDTLFKKAKQSGISSRVASKIADSVARKRNPPRYTPFTYSYGDFEKFGNTLKGQDFSDEQIEKVTTYLVTATQNQGEKFRGRSLGIAIREE